MNRYIDHIFVLPEDDANRQIANGFINDSNIIRRVIQVLSPAGGWTHVMDIFTKNHVKEMRKFDKQILVLLIDFDGRQDRLNNIRVQIPSELIDRVFILGVQSNPEQLKTSTHKSFEAIGEALAQDCSENNNQLWQHPLLIHNQPELERMTQSVKPFLFRQTS